MHEEIHKIISFDINSVQMLHFYRTNIVFISGNKCLQMNFIKKMKNRHFKKHEEEINVFCRKLTAHVQDTKVIQIQAIIKSFNS